MNFYNFGQFTRIISFNSENNTVLYCSFHFVNEATQAKRDLSLVKVTWVVDARTAFKSCFDLSDSRSIHVDSQVLCVLTCKNQRIDELEFPSALILNTNPPPLSLSIIPFSGHREYR